MHWPEERYVRLYTRDTVAWKRMRWEARAVLPLIMRKLDRMGSVDLGDDGLEGLSDLIDMPVTVVRDGVTDLLKRKTFTMNGSVLVMPNFMEAQEVPKTDAERAREYRARKRSELVGNSSTDAAPDSRPSVTNVTSERDASQNVTPIRSVPNQTEPPVRDGVRDESVGPNPARLHSSTEDYGLGEAYAAVVDAETGSYALPRFGEKDIGRAAAKHGPKTSIGDRVAWVREAAALFVSSTKDDDFARGGYAPAKFLTWCNDGGYRRAKTAARRDEPVVEYEPPWKNEPRATPEEVARAREEILAGLEGGHG